MSLTRWFWAFFLEKNQKKVFCVVKWAKTNAYALIGKMKADKLPNLFQPIKLRKNDSSIGWKRFCSFISLHLAYRESVSFSPFYETKQFFPDKKALKINAPNSLFQNEPKFVCIISDFFNKFLKTWNWIIWQKKSGDWT